MTDRKPDLPLQQNKKQVHHSYIWLSGLGTAFTVAVAIAFSVTMGLLGEGISIMQGSAPGKILLGVAGLIVIFIVIAAIIIGIQALAYKHLFYELGDEEFSVYSGIFTKRRVHVPYQRIQSVNQRAAIPQRIAGVCTLSIDTAGGSTNKAVLVPYVQNTEAERLRSELFARKKMILSGQAAQQTAAQAASQAQVPGTISSAQQAPAQATVLAPGQAEAQGQNESHPTNILDAPAGLSSDMRGIFGGEAVDEGEVSYEYGLSNKELILSGLSNSTGFTLIVVAAIGGAMSIIGYAMQTSIGQSLVQQGMNLAMELVMSNFIGIIVGIVLLVLAVVWAFSVLGTCISYGGFRASRRSTRIEVKRGLLQHQFHGVDIDRVQSVIIKQGFIRRFFGYCELSLGKIDAMTGEASEGQKQQNLQQGLVIHPFVKLTRVPEILAGLVPEFADVPTSQITLPRASLRRAIIRRCILHGSGIILAVIVAIVQIFINSFVSDNSVVNALWDMTVVYMTNTICLLLYALALIILVFEVIGSFMWYKNSSFAYNKDFMQITNGGFSRESISFPRKKIQFSVVRSNPLQRRKQVATINARTAAGIGGTTMRLLDVSEDEAYKWLEWVIPGGNRCE